MGEKAGPAVGGLWLGVGGGGGGAERGQEQERGGLSSPEEAQEPEGRGEG